MAVVATQRDEPILDWLDPVNSALFHHAQSPVTDYFSFVLCHCGAWQMLVDAGADPLAREPKGQMSSLHAAVIGGCQNEAAGVDTGVFKYLIDIGTATARACRVDRGLGRGGLTSLIVVGDRP